MGAGFQDAISRLLLIYISSFCLNGLVVWTSLKRSQGWLPSIPKPLQASAAVMERAVSSELDFPRGEGSLTVGAIAQHVTVLYPRKKA